MTAHVTDPVASLSSRPPVFARPDETLRDVAHRLWEESIGALVVGSPHHPLGVISERDVVGALAVGADPDVLTAGEAMTAYVISARPDDPVFDAASQMIDDAMRHIPIIDTDGVVVGVVSARDLLRPLLIDALAGTKNAPEG